MGRRALTLSWVWAAAALSEVISPLDYPPVAFVLVVAAAFQRRWSISERGAQPPNLALNQPLAINTGAGLGPQKICIAEVTEV